jgi:hypothetical protein
MNLKEQILAANDRPAPEPVDVPEWGTKVFIRVMAGAERDAFETENFRMNGKSVEINRENTRARLLVRCLCDETGNRIFADSDAAQLGEKSAAVLDPLFDRAQRLNKLTKKDIDELTKNS